MTGLTKAECVAWCSERDLDLPAIGSTGWPTTLVRHKILIPKDSGQRVELDRYLWSLCQEQSQSHALLWTTQWGVWPSCEHAPLFYALRERYNERRPLIEAPGCLFDIRNDDGFSFFLVASLFFWDVWLYSDTAMVAFLSHDEYGFVFETPGRLENVMKYLRAHGVLAEK